MSYDENDALQDAFYEQIGNEAIDGFTRERLQSYYGDHWTAMQPALRSLHEARGLLKDDHVTAATVFAGAAVELFLKNTILKPLVYGLVHNEVMAEVVVKYTFGRTGYVWYASLLKNIFQEIAGLDIGTVTRTGSRKCLLEECQALAARRNEILHSGEAATRQDAELSIVVAEAVYWLFVAHMLTALGLYIFADGVISRSAFHRPVRTVKNAQGIRVLAEAMSLSRDDHPVLAGTALPVPPEPLL